MGKRKYSNEEYDDPGNKTIEKSNLISDMRIKEDKRSILYVDDEEVNLRVFKYAFRRDYNVYTAISGEDALELLKEAKIDVVITDQRMPNMTGVELLRNISRTDPNIIRIIMTGFSDVGALVEAVNDIGISKYLKKPWDKHQLKDTIDKELDVYLHSQGITTTTNSSIVVDQELLDTTMFVQDLILEEGNDLDRLFEHNIILRKNPVSTTSDIYWFGAIGNKKVLLLLDLNIMGMISGLLTAAIHGVISEMIYSSNGVVEAPTLRDQLMNDLEDKLIIANQRKYSQGPIQMSVIVIDEAEGTIDCCSDGRNIILIGLNNVKRIFSQSYQGNLDEIKRALIFSDGSAAVFNEESLVRSSDFPINRQHDFLLHEYNKWSEGNNLKDSLTVIGFDL